MIESYQKGLTTELYAQQAFIKRGYMVSVPIGACKYDLIADINGSLYKIQVKSCTPHDNEAYICIKNRTTNIRSMTTNYYSAEDVDFYFTHYNEVDYLIPFAEAGKGQTTLRFNSQINQPSIRWAKDYEMDTILRRYNKI